MKALLAAEIEWISDEAREAYELLISTVGSPRNWHLENIDWRWK